MVDITSSTLETDIIEAVNENVRADFLASDICKELSTIWLEVWDADEIEKRKELMAKECGKYCSEVVQAVLTKDTEMKQSYIQRIEALLAEINTLQSDLGTPIPYEDLASHPLHNMSLLLNKKADKYRKIRNARVEKLTDLREKETYLCNLLGMVPSNVACSNVPTDEELKQIELHVESLEREKVDRMFTFLEKRKIIVDLYTELGCQPMLKFEKEVMRDENGESFQVNNINMALLDDLQRRLEEQLRDAKETAAGLAEKLTMIWKYLDESESYRTVFLNNHSGHTASVITAMREELAQCEAIKRSNISKIVERIRKMLIEEWDRCLIAQEERDSFRPFRIDCFTEDLCDLHEFEIERLKTYYNDNEQIFTHYAKHQKLFHKLLDLENRGKNSKRYYNRGGQLLQEERERKQITKELPVIEEELRSLLAQYEATTGSQFKAFGEPLAKVINDQWKAHFDQKMIDQLMRKAGSEKKRNTPLRKRVWPTPSSAAVASKVSRLQPVVSSTTPAARLPTVRRKLLKESDEVDMTFIIEPTYDDFQHGLQAKVANSDETRRNVTRSTAVMEALTPNRRVLRERNTPQRLAVRTTPVKPTFGGPRLTPCKTPVTLPRVARRKSALQRSPSTLDLPRLTPARNHLPIIF